jgi:type IV fimbrial biogenesis protein FimT
MRRKGSTAGFTLIELLIVVALSAIMMTLAVPSFQNMVANNRITSHTNELVMAINMARSEAVKRNVRVILCRSADPAASPPACGGSANDWTTGWLLFASGDANTTYQEGVDTLIRVGDAARTGIQIRTNGTSDNNLQINSNGSTNEAGGTAAFAICDDRDSDGDFDEQWGRQIQVSPSGHVRLIRAPIPNCQAPATV